MTPTLPYDFNYFLLLSISCSIVYMIQGLVSGAIVSLKATVKVQSCIIRTQSDSGFRTRLEGRKHNVNQTVTFPSAYWVLTIFLERIGISAYLSRFIFLIIA